MGTLYVSTSSHPTPRKIGTASGKGGVGKTAVSIGLAFALKELGYRVGLLDCDIESSSLGDCLGLSHDKLVMGAAIEPVDVAGVKVMSLSLFPGDDWSDTPTLIDEERVSGIINQMFVAVNWGDLDYLVLDLPPGTGPELRALIRHGMDAIILVTSAQRTSQMPVRRLIRMAREECHIPIIGIVANDPYRVGGDQVEQTTGAVLAAMYGLPVLASLPWDIEILRAMDEKRPGPAARFIPAAEAAAKFFGDRPPAITKKEEIPEPVLTCLQRSARYPGICILLAGHDGPHEFRPDQAPAIPEIPAAPVAQDPPAAPEEQEPAMTREERRKAQTRAASKRYAASQKAAKQPKKETKKEKTHAAAK